MRLVLPAEAYRDSYLEAELELAAEGKQNIATAETFATMLDALEGLRTGARVPDGFTQTIELWIVDGDAYLGKLQIRPVAKGERGHAGVLIRPSCRRRGIATKSVELARPHLAALGIDRVVLTCSRENPVSRALIERAGGVLDAESVDSPMLRFVALGPRD